MPIPDRGSQSPFHLCVLVNAWPKISTTFVAQEIAGLENNGLTVWLAALKTGDDIRHELHDRIRAPLTYAPEHSVHRPLAALRDFVAARRRWQSLSTFGSLSRYVASLIGNGDFAVAVSLAARLPQRTNMIYFHFLSPTGMVAKHLARITGLPYAGSAHAKDIWLTAEEEIREVLKDAAWLTTCNGPAADRLRGLAPPGVPIEMIHHGVDLDRFPGKIPVRPRRDGSDTQNPVRMLSVGRAVRKKGFDVLLSALASLPSNLHWRWTHIGPGKQLRVLRQQAEELGVSDKIQWAGAQPQSAVITAYRESDLFVLPARQDRNGDQDGLPNVLMEAQTQGLACLATTFSAIPELIVDGQTGRLVPTDDPISLRDALADLICDPVKRERLGRAGRTRVEDHFRAEDGIKTIAGLLRQTGEKYERCRHETLIEPH